MKTGCSVKINESGGVGFGCVCLQLDEVLLCIAALVVGFYLSVGGF